MATVVGMREQNLESRICYLTQQHAETLKALHEEIQKLQKKNADLAFQMAMQDVISPEEDVFKRKAETLENQLRTQTNELSEVKEELSKKSKKLSMLEQQLRGQEKKHSDEKQQLKNRVRSLQSELECKSNNIAVLTHQLHTKKELIETSPRTETLQPAPPPKGNSLTGPSRRRLNMKRNVITIHPEKRRPNSGSIQLDPELTNSKDSVFDNAAPFLVQKRDVSPEVQVKVHPIKPPLPPIGGSVDSDGEDSSLTWAVRDLNLRGNSPKQEILAVDHSDVWRKNQKYKSTQSK